MQEMMTIPSYFMSLALSIGFSAEEKLEVNYIQQETRKLKMSLLISVGLD